MTQPLELITSWSLDIFIDVYIIDIVMYCLKHDTTNLN